MATLESLIDELTDDLNEEIYAAMFMASDTAIDLSPVDTSRFKNAWRIGIDGSTPEQSSDVYDMSGGAAQRIIESQMDGFSIDTNESITLYNNVLDPETNYNYAQTVGYDFSGGTAYDLMSSAEQTLYSALG